MAAIARGLLSLVVAATTASTLAGCGYRAITGPAEGGTGQRVAIRTLGNDSKDPGVELLVTDALRREFLARGNMRVISDPRAADWVIRGRVQPIRLQSQSFSSVVLALEYRVTLSLDLSVENHDGRELRFDPATLRDSEIYLASADIEATRKNREEAIRRVASLIAGRVHDAMILEPVYFPEPEAVEGSEEAPGADPTDPGAELAPGREILLPEPEPEPEWPEP